MSNEYFDIAVELAKNQAKQTLSEPMGLERRLAIVEALVEILLNRSEEIINRMNQHVEYNHDR
jgi:hypothetical protein